MGERGTKEFQNCFLARPWGYPLETESRMTAIHLFVESFSPGLSFSSPHLTF